nr:Rrf2 family transcriptional regulator [Sulfobacillus harzensis]
MKTSLKVGLAILDLLARSPNHPLTVREMAEKLRQSEKYLEQLLLPLRRARLVVSLRGPHGGYRIARPASYITLLEIAQLLQGPITFCDCPTRDCRDCLSPPIWQALESCIETSMAGVTLADIMAGRFPMVPRRVALGPDWVEGGLGI